MLVEPPKKSRRIFHQTVSISQSDDEPENAISQNETMLEDLCPVIRRDNETEEIFDSVIPSSLGTTENQQANSEEVEIITTEPVVNEKSDDNDEDDDLFPKTQSPMRTTKSLNKKRSIRGQRTLVIENLAKNQQANSEEGEITT